MQQDRDAVAIGAACQQANRNTLEPIHRKGQGVAQRSLKHVSILLNLATLAYVEVINTSAVYLMYIQNTYTFVE
jgi:hypothetical protein